MCVCVCVCACYRVFFSIHLFRVFLTRLLFLSRHQQSPRPSPCRQGGRSLIPLSRIRKVRFNEKAGGENSSFLMFPAVTVHTKNLLDSKLSRIGQLVHPAPSPLSQPPGSHQCFWQWAADGHGRGMSRD